MRQDIKSAQTRLQTMLAEKLTDFMPESAIKDSLHKEATTKIFEGDTYASQKLGLKPADITLRDYLGLISANHLLDPFVQETTRSEARKTHAEQYENHIAHTDANASDPAITLKKWHGYMDALTQLADEGKRPEPQALKDGIAIMKNIIHHAEHAITAAPGKTSSPRELQLAQYKVKAEAIVLGIITAKTKTRPDYMPETMHEDIVAYGKILNHFGTAAVAASKDSFMPKLMKLVEEEFPISGRDYKKFRDRITGPGHQDAHTSNSLLHIINETKGVARKLGISLRASERE